MLLKDKKIVFKQRQNSTTVNSFAEAPGRLLLYRIVVKCSACGIDCRQTQLVESLMQLIIHLTNLASLESHTQVVYLHSDCY